MKPDAPMLTSVNNGAGSGRGAPDRAARDIQDMIDKIDALPDPAAGMLLRECLHSVLSLHSAALESVLSHLRKAGDAGQGILGRMLKDPSICGILLIHNLHPTDLRTRLDEALSHVRPYMASHGGDVELISLENEYARLRFRGTCKTCPSSTITMELAVRRAVESACPDLAGLELEPADGPLVENELKCAEPQP